MINTPLQIGKTNRVNLLTDTAVFLTIKDYGLQDGLRAKYYEERGKKNLKVELPVLLLYYFH